METQIARVQVRRATQAALTLPLERIVIPATIPSSVARPTLSINSAPKTQLMARCPQFDMSLALGRKQTEPVAESRPSRRRRESAHSTGSIGLIWSSWVNRFLRPSHGHMASVDALSAIPAGRLQAAHVAISLVMSLAVTAFVGSFLMVLFSAIS